MHGRLTAPGDHADSYDANRRLWDAWTLVHAAGEFYDLEGFRAGGVRLRDEEIAAVGDVRGKTLLHLQCHFGIDTLSWARLGARVTGADFSVAAIRLAREIAADIGIEDARFVKSNLYDLPKNPASCGRPTPTGSIAIPSYSRSRVPTRIRVPMSGISRSTAGTTAWARSSRRSSTPACGSSHSRSIPTSTGRPTSSWRASRAADASCCRPGAGICRWRSRYARRSRRPADRAYTSRSSFPRTEDLRPFGTRTIEDRR